VSVSASFAQKFWGAVSCPVVAVETPASITPADERPERVGWFGGETVLLELETTEPSVIVDAIASRVV
jgi:hypothetical protein